MKDYSKYLSVSLKVYIFVLICVFILKIVGLDYFGLDVKNSIVVAIDNFVNNYYLTNVYYVLTLYLYTLFIITLVFDRNDKKIKWICVLFTIIGIGIKFIESKIADANINCLIDVIYLFSMVMITNIKYKQSKILKRTVLVFGLNIFYQLITFAIRSINYTEQNSFILNMILYIDYLLLLLITYKVYFMKGGKKLCGTVVGSFSQKKKHFINSLKNLQINYSNFKKLKKSEKATLIIYSILSLIWNIFTLVVVLFVAKLNDTFIECIFIITSFWLSKNAFGKPFHLKSMMLCFIISNVSYYILNRITTPIGISVLIPVLLGVGLSYITSKFVKKKYKALYKGMSKKDFDESILKVVDKDSYKYEICYEYFIERKNAIVLGRKYNYTESGIRKIASRINDEIKALE